MNRKIALMEAISIGIGGMVGGGIFAVLGLAVSLARGGTPLAFLLAGCLALITSYSYVNLSKRYPDRGGTVKFINEGFGKSIFSGAINNLLWVSYIIMLALYASAFGSYAPNLFKITSYPKVDFHMYANAIVLLATAINYYSVAIVGKIEAYAVAIKLLILLGFVFLGAYGLVGNPNLVQLEKEHWEPPLKLFTGGMVIFVAYEGFELIANAAPDIIDSKKNIPRAYYGSLIFVVLLYIAIAVVTVGSLPFEKIAGAQDYVLAEAAEPLLGRLGFGTITVAALISTFSAINASLYGGSRVNYEIAEDDELPHHYLAQFWNQPVGLLVTAIATLVLVNLLELESISTAGSVGFLLIFSMVNFVGFRLSSEIGGNKVVPFLGFILCLVALAVLLAQQFGTNWVGATVALGLIGACFLMEWLYKRAEGRRK